MLRVLGREAREVFKKKIVGAIGKTACGKTNFNCNGHLKKIKEA